MPATFEELFPEVAQKPFEPIITGRSKLADVREHAVGALDLGSGVNAGNGQFLDAFGDLLSQSPAQPQPESGTQWKDYGKSLVSGVGQVGQMAAGALEYAGNRLAGAGNTPFEQGASDFAGAMRGARQGAQEFSQDWFSSMTPEAQQRAAREVTTLDPSKTIWQGGPGEFLSSVGLKMAQSAPSTIATLLPGALWMRAGMTGGAIAYLGASEGALSVGSIASNIAQEVEQAPEAELMQSDRYKQLRGQMDDATARQQLIQEAQGYAPLVGGLVVGAISAVAGRYLEPIFTDKAAGLTGRFARGFTSEAGQEAGQSAAEQLAQNVAAQVYDRSRSTFQGVGEQAVQGGMVGGLMGGATVAALGPRPTPPGTTPELTTPQEPAMGGRPPPAPSGAASFEEVFGEGDAGPTPTQFNAAGQGALDLGGAPNSGSLNEMQARARYVENPQPSLQRRSQLADHIVLGGVDPDQQAALSARRDKMIPDMFDEQAATPLAGPGGADMQQVWSRNEQMDLPQSPPLPGTAVVPAAGQMPLPMTERIPGVGRMPVTPMAGQPLTEDNVPPSAVSNERIDQVPDVRGRTRADFIRAAEEQKRIGRYKGTYQDENQLDLVSGPAAPASREHIAALDAELRQGIDDLQQAGLPAAQNVKRIYDQFQRAVKYGITNGQLRELHRTLAQYSTDTAPMEVKGIEPARLPDTPSREPLGDLLAQLSDLQDSDNPRTGVYLAPDNIEQLRRDRTFERLRGAGVPLPNFDGKGGTLIAKNKATAEHLLALRDSGTQDMQEILGKATGAGVGKLVGANIAVQQRDAQGNVTRESLANNAAHADVLAARFEEEPDRTAVILSAPAAIRRREQRIKQESLAAGAQADIKQTRRKVEEVVRGELGETPLGERAIKKTSRALSENEAARKVVEYGRRLRKREIAKRIEGMDRPETLEFENPGAAQEYQSLFGKYATAVSKQDKVEAEKVREQIAAHRKINKTTTPSERVVRAAGKISEEEVRKIAKEAREKARSRVSDEGTNEAEVRGSIRRLSRDELSKLDTPELNRLFVESANYIAGRKRSSHSFEDIVKAYPSPSEKRKLVSRVQSLMKRRDYGGKIKTPPITRKATKAGIRHGTLSTRVLTVENEKREMSKQEAAELNKRAREGFHQLSKQLVKADNISQQLDDFKEGESVDARNALYGKAYLRTLFEYGRTLAAAGNKTQAGLREIEKFNDTIKKLDTTPQAQLPEVLSNLFRAETREQVREATAVDPKRLGSLRDPERRRALFKSQNAKLKEGLARQARLEQVWKKNGHFNNSVAPVMRKVADSVALDGWPSYKPTEAEMRGLQFALRIFRGKENTRNGLFKPLKRWFADLGMQFNGQDLIVPMQDGKFHYSNEKALLAQFQRRFSRETETRPAVSTQEVNRMQAQRREAVVRTGAIEAPLTQIQIERFSKTEQLNKAIAELRKTVGKSGATTLNILKAEDRFITALKEMGLYQSVGVGNQLARISSDGRYGQSITFRPVTPRLRDGSLTKEEAIQAMLELYKTIPLTEYVTKQVKQSATEAFRETGKSIDLTEEIAEEFRKQELTPEQRRLMQAYDERDQNTMDMRLIQEGLSIEQARPAAQRIADRLESGATTSLNNILDDLASSLPSNHVYQPLVRRLRRLNMNEATVRWGAEGALDKVIGRYGVVNGVRNVWLNRELLEARRQVGIDPAPILLHGLLHESVHAATHSALDTDRALRSRLGALMATVQIRLSREGVDIERIYGLKDSSVHEFVAEAFTNPVFQRQLSSVKFEGQTLWQRIVAFVKQTLGMENYSNDALSAVIRETGKLFTGEIAQSTRGTLAMEDVKEPNAANAIDKIIQSGRITKSIRDKARDVLNANKEGGSRFLLSALTMEQIRDFYVNSFGGAAGQLNQYMKAFFERNADNSASMEDADKLSREWTKLTEQLGPDRAIELSRFMTESTLYGIHGDLSLSNSGNAHIQSDTQKARHAELNRRWRALDKDTQNLYHDLSDYYHDTLRREVNLMTLNALRAYLTKGKDAELSEKDFDYKESDIEDLGLNTKEGLEREFGAFFEGNQSALDTILSIAHIPEMHQGPYFPLMRFGDYVVTAEKFLESKSFTSRKDAYGYAAKIQKEDPTLSVSLPMESDAGYTVTVKEKEVRMAETRTEAEEARKELLAIYNDGSVSQVQLKAQLYQREATISSGSALGTILSKLDDNPAAQAAIKDFYLRSLADGAFRKREIKRANRRGVDYDLQHRTFANYAKASAYYTSQLRYGYRLADALTGMQRYVEETAKGEHQVDISAVRMGEVVRELSTRDEMTTNPTTVGKWIRKGTALSQFMMLTSPSYWMINATQPWMVTLPWLSARSSAGEAAAALANAQKLIASPIVSQMGESWLGAKALTSKVAAERAFTVLEQVEEYIKKRGGARADEYINMLHKLKRESIIDLSFVAELRDIAEGQSTTLSQKVLDASRIMSHLTEVNNRIMTAVAAYDLYRNKGASEEAATGFAKQAVSLTQFNYSSANAPRLFQSNVGRLIFQFMKYPQHIYALLIDNFRRAVKFGTIDAAVAQKTLAGLFATHLAAGGIVGAMLQPIKWAIGLALMGLGDDDKGYNLKNAVSGENFDRMIRSATAELFGNDAGEILSAGLPRAAGVDLSNRMSLGQLYFIDLKPDTADSMLGSLVGSFGGPVLNMGLGAYRGAQYIHEGQVAKGMESFLPKFAKDIFKAIRYTSDGLTDATGKEIIGAKEMSPQQLFMQSIGMQPAQISEAYARRQAIRDARQSATDKRANLLLRYRNADPDERHQLAIEISEYNHAHPAQGITRSQLIKSIVSKRQREASIKHFGADLRRNELEFAEAGDIYNVEE